MSTDKAKDFISNLLFNPKYRIWRHILLIIVFALVSFKQMTYRYRNYSDSIGNYIYVICLISCIIYLSYLYVNLYYLVPRFLFNKKYKAYFAALLSIFIIHLMIDFGMEYVVDRIVQSRECISNLFLVIRGLMSFMIIFMCILGTTATALFKQRMLENQRLSRMEQEHIKSELDRLKEHISPAFLSGILKKTSLSIKTEPQKASEMLMKLGQLLRYQLYDCSRDKVLLSAEIKFLKEYLNLEQLYSKRFEYKLTADTNIKQLFVSPLLFIPFIQQSVNQMEETDKTVSLDLHFRMEEQDLIFTCQSNYDEMLSVSKLFAIKKRLNLIYSENYCLSVNEGVAILRFTNILGL